MLNSIETYRETGKQAAECRNRKDSAGYEFHRNWFNRARALESAENRVEAQTAWDAGWAEARVVPTPLPFR